MINLSDIQIDELPSVALIEPERPAMEILKVVVEGKRKASGVSAELLR
ncbi:hypothetical protein Lepto7375DRAFT_1259 [Leptolyngbya sp. PCC 7375]|nr:hypothetical protein Lepto7375DRAFT_1259 [Leptolyngbya sp. PCC 7375]